MLRFKIYNKHSGFYLGEFVGQTEEIALDNMAKEVGYKDYPDLLEQIPGSSVKELEIYEVSQ